MIFFPGPRGRAVFKKQDGSSGSFRYSDAGKCLGRKPGEKFMQRETVKIIGAGREEAFFGRW